jgi:hypothetical protein
MPPTNDREAVCSSEPLAVEQRPSIDMSALRTPVDAVRVDGAVDVPTEVVRLLLTRTPNGALEPSELRDADRRLFALSAIDQLGFHREPTPTGTTLVVSLRERPSVREVFFVGNARDAASRFGLSPERGDVFDRDVLVTTARAVEHTWSDLGEAMPRVTVHARVAEGGGVDVCVRATALDPYGLERGATEIEQLVVEQANERPEGPAVRNADLVAYVNRVGAKVASAIGRGTERVRFVVVDEPAIDARAIAALGVVRVNRGLLAILDNEAQLAALLGHELGHVALRHGIVDIGTRALGGDANADEARRSEAYHQMQADRIAIEALERLGYDPHEVLVALAKVLEAGFERVATVEMASYMFARMSRIRMLLHGRHGGRHSSFRATPRAVPEGDLPTETRTPSR